MMSVKGKSISELYSLIAQRVMSSVYSQQRCITRRFSPAFLVNHHECQTVDISKSSHDSYERKHSTTTAVIDPSFTSRSLEV